ncbi:hypothetical protein AVEN_64466-1 [Araneus ventricosus]|uniref:Uncharacterized protein n=1 Tax=Araneus ventricosus TaxID=182803 RepID=A0A4Y2NZK9_ARAVE|nr:hypothetical protein AVEN_64466-1 [Araneus ventricosus]
MQRGIPTQGSIIVPTVTAVPQLEWASHRWTKGHFSICADSPNCGNHLVELEICRGACRPTRWYFGKASTSRHSKRVLTRQGKASKNVSSARDAWGMTVRLGALMMRRGLSHRSQQTAINRVIHPCREI